MMRARVSTSIRRELLVWLLGGMLASAILAGLIAYVYALHAADIVFDRHLQHIAVNLPSQILPQPEPPDNGDPSDDVYIQIRDQAGNRTYPTRPTVQIPPYPSTGYASFEFNDLRWRVYTEKQAGRYVQVAQSEDVRRRLATSLAVSTTIPFLAIIPLLGLIIWNVVQRSAGAMLHVARAVERRSAEALDPLPLERIPGEVLPMVSALNDLLLRLGHALTAQRVFIADAAHELRSPLTALKLHLQLTERARTDAQRDIAFAKVRERVDRMAHLVEQLLQLAREEPSGGAKPFVPVAVGPILQSVVGDNAPHADSEGVTLQCLGCDEHVIVQAQPDSLRILFNNLVDNAIRYTGQNGRVVVTVGDAHGHPWVDVEDNGPGIPLDQRERVFDRFHRVGGTEKIGSGLGLAIVRAIAERHNARVTLHEGLDGHGLRVRVSFPWVADDDEAEADEAVA